MSMREISKGSTTSLSQSLKKKIARLLVSRNFMELITWSFVDKKWEEKIDPNKKKILINNPISEELGCLRSSLYTNILLAIKKNENRGMKNLRFFEIGPIFYGSEPGDQDLIVSVSLVELLFIAAEGPVHFWFSYRLDILSSRNSIIFPIGILYDFEFKKNSR